MKLKNSLSLSLFSLSLCLALPKAAHAQSAWDISKGGWDGIAKKDYDAVVANADHAIASWGVQARQQNQGFDSLPKKAQAHKLNFLNGVSTALFLKGEALLKKGDKAGALKVYRILIKDYQWGQCWDNKGWFWHPATEALARIEELDPKSVQPIHLDTPPLSPRLKFPGKKGICFTLRAKGKKGSYETNLARTQKTNPYWNYSWGSKRIVQQPNNIEFTPMTWGAWSKEGLQKEIDQNIKPQMSSGQAKRILGFNEPDLHKQANMSVNNALKFWPQLEALGIPLCSPACANPLGDNDSSNQGVHGTWMRDFMKEVEKRELRVDYIGVHWYGGANPRVFKQRMLKIYEAYGKRPLVISEFAVADWGAKTVVQNKHSKEDILKFMKNVLPWMEKQNWIAGYSWFSFEIDEPVGTSSSLFDREGNLTTLGRYYESVTTERPEGDQSIK